MYFQMRITESLNILGKAHLTIDLLVNSPYRVVNLMHFFPHSSVYLVNIIYIFSTNFDLHFNIKSNFEY